MDAEGEKRIQRLEEGMKRTETEGTASDGQVNKGMNGQYWDGCLIQPGLKTSNCCLQSVCSHQRFTQLVPYSLGLSLVVLLFSHSVLL